MTLARALLQADSLKPIVQHRLVGGIFGSDSFSIDCIVFDAPVLGGRVLQDLLLLLLARLKSLILTNHWQTIELVKKIELPIFYVTCVHDEIVPAWMTHELYEASQAASFK